jgi:hypothetical protein
MRTEPVLSGALWAEADMKLPDGKTCVDCVHFNRCSTLFGHIESDEVCDWAPSRFREPVTANNYQGGSNVNTL